jgi:two-component system, chemotaxis family, protein-glutamate methylesterase/glutaminase
MAALIRTLIVDDSAFARKVLREILAGSPRIEVVGIARDGLDALEKIEELKPDVVTLDLVMPHLDGIGVLQALRVRAAPDTPRVVIVSMSDAESDLCIQALQCGAVDLVHKPTALATDRLYELSAELLHKIEIAAGARFALTPAPLAPAPTPSQPPERASSPLVAATSFAGRALVIGTSTGGPQALTQLIPALPGNFPFPIAIVVHIPVGYTEALARRLDQVSALSVVEAWDGLDVGPGMAVIARAGMHLRLERRGDGALARLDIRPLTSPHRPSVDVLFESAAEAFGAGALGVVLTGMGDDGLQGARAIHAAGGTILTESQSSCVVYGMPRCVREAGLALAEAPLSAMAAEILRYL